MICTRHVTADDQPEWSGAPCPECGHTSLGHPGITNLTLDACLVCEVQAAVQQLRDTIAAAQLDVLGEQVRDLNDDAANWVDRSELAELRARIERLEAPSSWEGQ